MNDSQLHAEVRKAVQDTMHDAGLMTREDVSRVVREAVHETLLTLGVDAESPISTQQDMHFLRELRGASETIRSRGLIVLVGILVTALVGAAWVGIRSAIVGAP